MTCRKWQYLLATAEACELDEKVALQEHLATCAECAQFAREMRAMRRALRSLDRLSPSPDFGDEVRRRLDGNCEASAMTAPAPGPGAAQMTHPLVAATALLGLLALWAAYYVAML